ncbi:adhesion G protein-coupled receptor L3-like [Ptychodera flava]|uniref:adhesion G protein-coupled receptor L3-like n=1 Tax=Ptychodera flava TaxID=63121 RepID=UPI00396AAB1E
MPTIYETDECLMASDGCEHECINTPDSFYCECRTGYEISQDKKTCDDIDECVTNENTCSITKDNTVCNNTDGGYTCECVKNTERSEEGKCEIVSADLVDWCKEQTLKVCSPIDTTGTVNHVSPLWPKTNVNCTTDWIACEGNLKGKRRRICGSDRQWGAIDDTFCMSKNITDVWNEHLNITDIPSNIKTLYDLRMVLSPGTTASSGDLVVGSEIFGRVIDLRYLSKMQGSVEVKERLIEETIQTASTLLDPDNAPLWENYIKFRGPIGGADVVVMHFDRFAAEVGEFMKTYDIKEIKVSSPNIDFQASVVHSSSHSSYTFPSPFPNKTNFFQNASFEMVNHDKESLVFIPAATVSAIADQAANGTTIIISALYRDLTRILSAETVTEEQTREWVTTITARKDVVAVNSDVFSVILQPNRFSETLPEPIIIKYYHKQEAWDPKCSFIQFGNSHSLWSADDCQMSTHNSAEAEDYTICECGHTTNFGLLMKLGPEPVFFLIEGMNIVVIIGYAHLLVFLCLTLMAVLLSRLRTDQYWVIINVLIAEVLKNIFLLVGSRQKTSSSMCALMAVMIHGCSLSCFTWTMIKCIQIYRRVRYCENSSKTWQRVMCLVGGWLIPAIIVTVLALTRLPMYRQSKQCWALEDSATSIMTVYTPIAVTLAVSVFLACYTCYLFDPMKSVSVKYDGDRTTLDVQVTCMYLVLLPASWFTGIGVAFADMTYVILRYIYAGLVFVKGSVLLLGVAGNNSEVMQGIRYSNLSDEDYREAWTELRDLEGTRLEIMIEYERDRADKLRECGVTRRRSARVQPSTSKTNNEDTKSEICEEHVKLESLGE